MSEEIAYETCTNLSPDRYLQAAAYKNLNGYANFRQFPIPNYTNTYLVLAVWLGGAGSSS
jgi:hypothetical protein